MEGSFHLLLKLQHCIHQLTCFHEFSKLLLIMGRIELLQKTQSHNLIASVMRCNPNYLLYIAADLTSVTSLAFPKAGRNCLSAIVCETIKAQYHPLKRELL